MEICIKGIFISICNLPVPIRVHKENIRTKRETPEAYSELSRTSKMELFPKILNGFQLLTIVFIKDVYQEPSQTFEMKLFAKLVNSV